MCSHTTLLLNKKESYSSQEAISSSCNNTSIYNNITNQGGAISVCNSIAFSQCTTLNLCSHAKRYIMTKHSYSFANFNSPGKDEPITDYFFNKTDACTEHVLTAISQILFPSLLRQLQLDNCVLWLLCLPHDNVHSQLLWSSDTTHTIMQYTHFADSAG